MNRMVNLSVVQLCSVPNVQENINTIDRLLMQIKPSISAGTQHLVVLPECCLFFGGADKEQLALAQTNKILSNDLINKLSALAVKHNIYLVAGSIPKPVSNDDNKFTNTSLVFNPQGVLVSEYDKIHLFDVVVEDSEKQYLESKYTQAGDKVVNAKLPFANIGLSICYDIRFPELFRCLTEQGADIITVPAAFTRVTGQVHWQALLQARAIENQVYILASGQEGTHANGRETWGHSMIISPWGEILAEIVQGEGIISVPFDRQKIVLARQSIPVADHNQFKTEMKI